MSKILSLRLVLDTIAVALLLLCLAYWWLDNLAHEIFGTLLISLVLLHNGFNRRWYGGLSKRRMDAVRIVNLATILLFALGMVVMTVTSLLIARDVMPYTALDGAFAVREIHMFSAYWLLLVLSVHLGTRWQVVMTLYGSMIGVSRNNLYRQAVLRLASLIIVIWGIKSWFEMGFGSKLLLTYSLDMWDFTESSLLFFVNYASIIGLFAVLTYYGLALIARSDRRRQTRPVD